MKRVWALLLAAVMLLAGCAAAETAEETAAETAEQMTEETEAVSGPQTLNFGDFDITLDPQMAADVYEKADNALWFTLYPALNEKQDASITFACIWSAQNVGLDSWTEEDLTGYTAEVWDGIVAGLEEQKIVATDVQLEEAAIGELGGRRALYYAFEAVYDYSGLGEGYEGAVIPIYQRYRTVSGDFGTYTFLGTAVDKAAVDEWIQPLMDAIVFH